MLSSDAVVSDTFDLSVTLSNTNVHHRHRHRSSMFQKTLPSTELQCSGTVTTLIPFDNGNDNKYYVCLLNTYSALNQVHNDIRQQHKKIFTCIKTEQNVACTIFIISPTKDKGFVSIGNSCVTIPMIRCLLILIIIRCR